MHTGDTIEIELMPYGTSANELQNRMETVLGKTDGLFFEVRPPMSRFRAIEPSVLVAIVAGSGGALAALVSGLLKICQQNSSKRIVIQTKAGAKIDVPADTSAEHIRELSDQIRDMDSPRIVL